jgi:hypothetical protein
MIAGVTLDHLYFLALASTSFFQVIDSQLSQVSGVSETEVEAASSLRDIISKNYVLYAVIYDVDTN